MPACYADASAHIASYQHRAYISLALLAPRINSLLAHQRIINILSRIIFLSMFRALRHMSIIFALRA